jgi:hypothetical protein
VRGRRALAAVRLIDRSDWWALLGLGILFIALAALSWKTWGDPQADFGVELTAADRIAHGATLYQDIRYFYGPLGVHCLALAFAVFGTSFTTAFAFGLAVALSIFVAFYCLARVWLTPLFATAATTIVMAIGFTGTLFGYVAPHTTSATVGILALLLQLLALARGRVALAGVAAGAVMLTRPELMLAALACAAAFALGRALESGPRAALRDAALLFGPALAIPLVALAPFALAVGPGDLVFNQLIPLDFTRVSGLRAHAEWAPYDATSIVALGVRGSIYFAAVAALAAATALWSSGRRRGQFLVPLLIAGGGLLALALAARLTGAFPGTRGVVQTEALRLILAMSWLPAATVAVAVWAAARARQGRPAPISGKWSLDLALIATALALALRTYNSFTTDTYAAYYAAPLVLLAAIVHQRAAARFPAARSGIVVALGVVFCCLAWNAVASGPARTDTFTLHTARGSYLASAGAGPQYQRALDIVRRDSRPGEPVLGLPIEGGLPFAADRPPALRDLQLYPGVLDSRTDEEEAIATLRESHVGLVLEGNSRFDGWGYPQIGVDYNRLLLRTIARRYPRVVEVGDFSDAPVDQFFPLAFRIYERNQDEVAR